MVELTEPAGVIGLPLVAPVTLVILAVDNETINWFPPARLFTSPVKIYPGVPCGIVKLENVIPIIYV